MLQLVNNGNMLGHRASADPCQCSGFFYVILAVLTFIYFVCSIRTNVCLFIALFLLTIAAALFAGAYFQLAVGNDLLASKLQTVRAHQVNSWF
jgi:succinate-acetate transporter protein